MAVVTALYGSILGLMIVALGINVTAHRVKLAVPLGDGDNPVMLRMMRIHANAIEYLPIAVLLMLVYELNAGMRILLHVVGIALVVGRILQTAAMWSTPLPGAGRGIGQSLTWLSITVLAIANLVKLI
jgi:uncharacterized membrane protein YecN with MAPEG domain